DYYCCSFTTTGTFIF
nr:immunoglobulin light chain junction region [Macaca mulatta]MOX82378.1 immunoglobulin light chain junction region [Macaca mulatta]MOX83896.1 immunoglobulin light chain junction region [Macaca mulatta]MOX84022.1 immunoglobulin light chain junction region [Macaca mulatta]